MDTIGRAVVEEVSLPEALWDFVLRVICSRRGHRWQLYARMRYGVRDYCVRCHSNRIVFEDGEEIVATAVELKAAAVPFGEALYEARWGEPPRQKMRYGEWPAP